MNCFMVSARHFFILRHCTVNMHLQGAQMYPGESLADYAPHSTSAPEAAHSAEYDPINDDADDLPF